MLIINADDYGINRSATDNSLECYRNGKITSVSAMMFMEDSERASTVALDNAMDVGLHLNFSLLFNGMVRHNKLRDYQKETVSFLTKGKYYLLLYNPLLKNQFQYVYNAQYEEFIRLYHQQPTHFDGHHHMHLCANVLLQNLIPDGMRVRTTFTFDKNERNFFNRSYRKLITCWLNKHYICTNYFYSIEPVIRNPSQRLRLISEIITRTKQASVEIMVHPSRQIEYDYLMSEEFSQVISQIETKRYGELN